VPGEPSSSPEVRQRFEREAKTISSLSHPHICTLYDVGTQDGTEYLLMEYRLCPFFGPTLSSSLARDALLVRPHRDGGEAE
jgi:serine/threonine protein kinase